MRATLLALSLVLVPMLARPVRASADVCEEDPSDMQVRHRLHLLTAAVEAEEPAVRRWYTTFGFLHATMMSVSIILAATAQEDGPRVDLVVASISSALGFTTLMIFTPPLMGGGASLRAMPEDTPTARLHKLRAAEDLLERSAASVDFMQGWFPATGTGVYITAAASTLLVGFDRLTAAYMNIAGGVVLGYGRLLLRPSGGRTRWRTYRSRYPDAGCELPTAAPAPQTRVQVQPFGLGLGLSVQF